MRWNCPHCGTALSVADEKLSNTWSFSKCFQCAGYALVRKSDVNLIKVDDAPKGEKIVRPQADIERTAHQDQIRLPDPIHVLVDEKKKVLKSAEAPTQMESLVTESSRLNQALDHVQTIELEPATSQFPVDEWQKSLAPRKVIPPARPSFAHAAGLSPVAVQSSAPVQSAVSEQTSAFFQSPAASAQSQTANNATATIKTDQKSEPTLKWMLPDSPEKSTGGDDTDEIRTAFNRRKIPSFQKTKLLPLGVGFLAAMAIGSGLMLIQESRRISQKRTRPKTTTAQLMNEISIPDSMKAVPTISDQVKEKAMAPSRDAAPIDAKVEARPVTSDKAVNTTDSVTEKKSTSLQQGAKAVAAEAIAALVVQIKVPTATLRSGPGLNFPVTGKARLSSNFVVKQWQGEWFQVSLPKEEGLDEPRFAWIRNDLVRLVTLDRQSGL